MRKYRIEVNMSFALPKEIEQLLKDGPNDTKMSEHDRLMVTAAWLSDQSSGLHVTDNGSLARFKGVKVTRLSDGGPTPADDDAALGDCKALLLHCEKVAEDIQRRTVDAAHLKMTRRRIEGMERRINRLELKTASHALRHNGKATTQIPINARFYTMLLKRYSELDSKMADDIAIAMTNAGESWSKRREALANSDRHSGQRGKSIPHDIDIIDPILNAPSKFPDFLKLFEDFTDLRDGLPPGDKDTGAK